MTPLRWALQSAIHARNRTLSMGWSRRKDHDAIRTSIGRAEVFLRSYPVAGDEQVREWCVRHRDDVSRIVPGNQPRVLSRLLMDELRTSVDVSSRMA